ncbi:MAG TPA: class I SAM-dependent methyltransferase [Gemmatimonadales bacterium]|nr:class I SAM-dependent methyltransferase [Gemmatimonadales bacterium]
MATPHSGPKGLTFQPDIYQKVLALLSTMPGPRLLDVGAGEGYFCELVRKEGFEVEACDARPDIFNVPGVPFHRADLNEAIPLPDEAFDGAVAIEVIEHLENHTRFVQELFRVVRKGGTVIITTPNVLSIPSRWHFFLYGYTDAARTPLDPARPDYYLQHINPISLPEILLLVERFGGELIGLHTNRFRRSARWLVPVLYPLLALALRRKLLRPKYAERRALHRRHLRWMLHPANLMGRITIALARRVT